MAESLPDVDAIARKTLATVLQAVAKVGQDTVAAACDIDDAAISRDKAKWERFCKMLVVAKLKIVPFDARCYTPDSIEPLLQLAKQRMAQLATVDQLQWEDHE